MSSYPNLTDGNPFRQTTKRTLSLRTEVLRTLDMKEQRYVCRTPTYRFEGQYGEIFSTDYSTLQGFHDSMQGRFGQFDLTFNGILYSNLYFDQDRIEFNEQSVNLYSTQVRLKGFPDHGFPTITVSDPTLPTLGSTGTGGPLTQWPSTLAHMQSNAIVDLDDTARYAFHRINTAIPCGVLQMPVITPAEAQRFEDFFLQLAGRYGIFTLVYNSITMHCRFDVDELVLDFSRDPGVVSITLPWCAPPI